MIVVDVSIGLKWFRREAGSDVAASLVDGPDELVAPDLFIAEVSNGIWKLVRAGILTDTQAKAVPVLLARAIVEFLPTMSLAPRALEIAVHLQHPAYDCFYLAMAEQRGIRLITADTRLLNQVAGT